jgi:hypothetical protein
MRIIYLALVTFVAGLGSLRSETAPPDRDSCRPQPTCRVLFSPLVPDEARGTITRSPVDPGDSVNVPPQPSNSQFGRPMVYPMPKN